MKRINWKAALSFGITLAGIAAHPAFAAQLPAKVSLGVAAFGAALQAVSETIYQKPQA